MSIKFVDFGKVQVEYGEEPILKSPFRTLINWRAIGSVDVETAKLFKDYLDEAILFAEKKQREYEQSNLDKKYTKGRLIK